MRRVCLKGNGWLWAWAGAGAGDKGLKVQASLAYKVRVGNGYISGRLWGFPTLHGLTGVILTANGPGDVRGVATLGCEGGAWK